MLEVLIIILLCNRNAQKVKQKGRRPGKFVFLTVLLWIGMEFIGAFIGTVVSLIVLGDVSFLSYLFALVFAVVGAIISVQIAKNAEPGNDDFIASHSGNAGAPQPSQPPYRGGNSIESQNNATWQPPQETAPISLEKEDADRSNPLN